MDQSQAIGKRCSIDLHKKLIQIGLSKKKGGVGEEQSFV
jgi:hypothetical protein